MKHPTNLDIERYSRGDIGYLKRTLIGIHLKKCGQCSSVLEKLKEDDNLLDQIKKAAIRQPDLEISESDSTYISLRKSLGGKGHSST